MKKEACSESSKVAIVGAGNVGCAAAYAMMLDGVVSELSIIDINKNKAEGEALDLRHGMQFTKSAKIWAGDSFDLVEGAKIVVLAAGFAQKPGGETRLDLLAKNVEVFKDIIPKIVKKNKDCILLVVTNPLDVLTYVTGKLSGFPSCRVFGTGTVLDSSRLRYLLGRYFTISPKDITAYILGEHGDSEFAWWSGANVAGMPLRNFARYSDGVMEKIYQEVKGAAYEVIAKKGATYYAIGLVVSKIVRAILTDQFRVMTVSSLLQNYNGIDNVCLSVPTIIRKSGICDVLKVSLDDGEQQQLEKSAQKIAQANEQAEKLL
ncbi:L-lactate dehydrogenase [Candidatus Dependentiae bacterium]|nr:L-lactate dehydrogenase [Candidatus Dependentiae bacterium]